MGFRNGGTAGRRWKHATEHGPHSQDTCRERGAVRRKKRNAGDSLLRYHGDSPARLPIDSSQSIDGREPPDFGAGYHCQASLGRDALGMIGQEDVSIHTASQTDTVAGDYRDVLLPSRRSRCDLLSVYV